MYASVSRPFQCPEGGATCHRSGHTARQGRVLLTGELPLGVPQAETSTGHPTERPTRQGGFPGLLHTLGSVLL